MICEFARPLSRILAPVLLASLYSLSDLFNPLHSDAVCCAVNEIIVLVGGFVLAAVISGYFMLDTMFWYDIITEYTWDIKDESEQPVSCNKNIFFFLYFCNFYVISNNAFYALIVHRSVKMSGLCVHLNKGKWGRAIMSQQYAFFFPVLL